MEIYIYIKLLVYYVEITCLFLVLDCNGVSTIGV